MRIMSKWRLNRGSNRPIALDGPAWHIAAPDFRPVPLGSRAIGLAAAARGTFQLGLSLDEDTKVHFPTLTALSEFVRRLYLSGGGVTGRGASDRTGRKAVHRGRAA